MCFRKKICFLIDKPLLKMKEDSCENGKLEIYRMPHEKVHFRVFNNIDTLYSNFEYKLVQAECNEAFC